MMEKTEEKKIITEILKGQVYVSKQILNESGMNKYISASVSFVDRENDKVIFMNTGIQSEISCLPVVRLSDGEMTDGKYSVPEDTETHLKIYRDNECVNSIVHFYSPWVMIFSEKCRGISIPEIYGETFVSDIPCVKDAEDIKEVKDYQFTNTGAFLINKKGAYVWSTTPYKAAEAAIVLERASEHEWKKIMMDSGEINPDPVSYGIKYQIKKDHYSEEELAYCGKPGDIITDEDQKRINMGLLVYFDKMCRENDIKYSLTGGTLLGAVRHGGFIPWDDDVDVFVTRPEYEKLRTIFTEGGRYEFVDMRKEGDFNYSFGRLIDKKTLITESPNTASAGRGLFLDICIVDGLPNSFILRELHMKYMRVLFRLRRACIHDSSSAKYKEKGKLITTLKRGIKKISTIQFWNRRMSNVMSKYPFDKSIYVGNFTSQYGKKELLHKNCFEGYFDISFEGFTFMICNGYEEYLSNIYSNYWRLPKRRKGHHPGCTYWV